MTHTIDKLLAMVAITRPHNCLIGGFSIFVGAIITHAIDSWLPVVYAVVSGVALTGGANTINDWYDLDIDRINRPQRVLPAGKLSRLAALILAIILFACGVFFSIFISKLAILIAVVSVLALVLYSAKLKRTVLWGNAAVSLMTALAFVYGAISVGRWQDGLIPAFFAFLFHFGREILKDMEDVKGDAAMSAVTLPIRYGRKAALIVITIVYSSLVLFTILPYTAHLYGTAYLVTIVVGVHSVLLTTLLLLWVKGAEANLRMLSSLLKADMLVGLLAIYLGPL